jgi:hypothetical protein
MMEFLFGEGTDAASAEELARKRAIINQLMSRDLQPQTFASGVRQFGGALAGRVGDRRLDPKEDAERERSSSEFARIAAMLGGAPMAAPPAPLAPSPMPMPPVDAVPATSAPMPPVTPMPPQIGAAVDRVPPPMTGATGNPMLPAVEQGIPLANYDAPNLLPPIVGGAGTSAPAGGPMGDTLSTSGPADMESMIRQGLVGRGMPAHIADAFIMNFRDESGLRTDINEIAPIVPGSRGGFGLAQWTGPRRRELEAFAQSRGTSVSDLDTQLDFLMSELQGSESQAAQSIFAAQDTPTAADAILRQFLRPAPEHQTSRSAAYLGGQEVGSGTPMGGPLTQASMSTMGGAPSGGGNMAIVMQLAELAGNPYLPEGQRMVAPMLLQQQMGTMFAPPPSQMDQIELERAQLELEQMRNPTATPVDLPPSAEEYLFYSERATAAGRDPMSYEDFLVLEAEAGNPALAQQQQDAQDVASDTILNAANRAFEAAQERIATGALGKVAAMNPASNNAEIYRQVESLRAVAAIENIAAMRRQSPTGAAMGAVSDRDIELLKDKAGALNPASPNFERDLADYTRTLLQIVHGYDEGQAIFTQRYVGAAASPETGATGGNRVLTWNPATGEFEE